MTDRAEQTEAIAFLLDPATHGGATVERIDTHGAIIILAGDRAFKLKRAVSFPYMDFSTLERRRVACLAELALNRRTAPEIYLETVAITRRADGALSLGGAGEPIEWVVAMRRFPEGDLLDRVAAVGGLTPELVRELAAAVATFHAGAEAVKSPGAHGGGGAGMRWVIDDNLQEMAAWPELIPPAELAELGRGSRQALARVAPLLDARLAGGQVRRCHGDLHLRNICLWRGRPTLFDAVEFNDRIAVIDVLYDLAFLLMDLETRGRVADANLLFNRYLQESWDLSGLPALPLFLSARAAVRAKVGASARERQADRAQAAALGTEVRRYFAAARAYLAPPAPGLVAIGGLSGSGKTSAARALASRLGPAPGAIHLRSDVLRKQLHGVAETARLPDAAYTQAASDAVYRRLLELAGQALAGGQAAILDAVQALPAERQAVEALARRAGVPFLGMWLEAPAAILKARASARVADASDATLSVVTAQLGFELGPLAWARIDAGGTPEATLASALAAFRPGGPALRAAAGRGILSQ